MPSVHGASILGYHQRSSDDDDEPKETAHVSFPANRDGWVRTIKDLGLQFDFVSSDQIEHGGLATNKYKVLILPFSIALSPEELKKIEQFARDGGVVIADAGTGMMDDHCAWTDNNSLSELFGILAMPAEKRTLKIGGGEILVTEQGARWGLAANNLTGLATAETEIKATEGTALMRVGQNDAVIVRKVGQGWTIYLNTLFDKYPKERAKDFGGASYRALVDRVLAGSVGLRPAVEVLSSDGKRLTQAQIVRYRFGDAEILAVVKDNLALSGIVGRDGVTTYNDAALGQIARQDIVIKLPQKRYVTDVRTGKRLGYTDVVHSSVLVGDAVLLGLSSAENTLALRGPAVSSRGEHPTFSISSSIPGERLIRVHVFGPGGSMLPAYACNLNMDHATTTFVLPSALNDPAGTYVIRATDVVTGARAETKITLN